MHKKVSTQLAALVMVFTTTTYFSLPTFAQERCNGFSRASLTHEEADLGLLTPSESGDSTFTKHYVAQNDQEEGGEQEQAEESAQSVDDSQSVDGTQSESGEQSDESGESSGGGSGERVGLATLFVQFIGMGLLVMFLLSLSVSATFLLCGLVWKIGMVARGGKKPDIG